MTSQAPARPGTQAPAPRCTRRPAQELLRLGQCTARGIARSARVILSVPGYGGSGSGADLSAGSSGRCCACQPTVVSLKVGKWDRAACCVFECHVPHHGERAGRIDDEEPAVWQSVFLGVSAGLGQRLEQAAGGQHGICSPRRGWTVVEVRALRARCQQPESGGRTSAKSHAAREPVLLRVPIQAQTQMSALFPGDESPRMLLKVPALKNDSGSSRAGSSIQATCTAAASQRHQNRQPKQGHANRAQMTQQHPAMLSRVPPRHTHTRPLRGMTGRSSRGGAA